MSDDNAPDDAGATLDLAEDPLAVFHLPGRHNQKSHGNRAGKSTNLPSEAGGVKTVTRDGPAPDIKRLRNAARALRTPPPPATGTPTVEDIRAVARKPAPVESARDRVGADISTGKTAPLDPGRPSGPADAVQRLNTPPPVGPDRTKKQTTADHVAAIGALDPAGRKAYVDQLFKQEIDEVAAAIGFRGSARDRERAIVADTPRRRPLPTGPPPTPAAPRQRSVEELQADHAEAQTALSDYLQDRADGGRHVPGREASLRADVDATGAELDALGAPRAGRRRFGRREEPTEQAPATVDVNTERTTALRNATDHARRLLGDTPTPNLVGIAAFDAYQEARAGRELTKDERIEQGRIRDRAVQGAIAEQSQAVVVAATAQAAGAANPEVRAEFEGMAAKAAAYVKEAKRQQGLIDREIAVDKAAAMQRERSAARAEPAPQAPSGSGATLGAQLAKATSREEAHALIESMKINKAGLIAALREENIPALSGDNIAALRRRLVESLVGRRLDSDAIMRNAGRRARDRSRGAEGEEGGLQIAPARAARPGSARARLNATISNPLSRLREATSRTDVAEALRPLLTKEQLGEVAQRIGLPAPSVRDSEAVIRLRITDEVLRSRGFAGRTYALTAAEGPKRWMWRGMLAPVDAVTGDKRRFAPGALTVLDKPMPLLWQERTGPGHEGSVIVGSILRAEVRGDLVYGEGSWRDTPAAREAMGLVRDRTVGPSVDLDMFAFESRLESGEKFAEQQHCSADGCPPVESVITQGRVRAATLVPIAAFAEAEIELYQVDDPGPEVDAEPDCAPCAAALVAAGPNAFTRPEPDHYQPIVVDGDAVYGHVAHWASCHTQYRHSCVQPPRSPSGYERFHRYAVDVEGAEGGWIRAGRLTVGLGRFAGRCGCCNADDHACGKLGLDDTIRHYDELETVAYVRAVEGEHGLWVSGVRAAGASPEALAVLARGVSGDWRDSGGALELAEVMGVSTTAPAFPAVGFASQGRVLSLVAAGAQLAPAEERADDVDQARATRAAELQSRLRVARASRLLDRIGG